LFRKDLVHFLPLDAAQMPQENLKKNNNNIIIIIIIIISSSSSSSSSIYIWSLCIYFELTAMTASFSRTKMTGCGVVVSTEIGVHLCKHSQWHKIDLSIKPVWHSKGKSHVTGCQNFTISKRQKVVKVVYSC